MIFQIHDTHTGDDLVYGGPGNDVIDGGAGFNTALYLGPRTNYTVTQADGKVVVTDTTGAEGTDTLTNIQRLIFSDVEVALTQVNQGWNFTGNTTVIPVNMASTFGDATKVNSVWKWIPTGTGKWDFYSPSLTGQALTDYAASKGYDVMTTVNGGEGFWVNANTAFTAQLPAGAKVTPTAFQNMTSGWHLIATGGTNTPSGFNTASSTTPAGSVPQNFSTLWAWDNPKGKWYFYSASLEAQGGIALSDYITSHGYLDFRSANKTLGPGVGF